MPVPYGSSMSQDSEDSCCQEVEFDTSMIPEIATWQVGGEYMIILKVKEIKHELEQDPDGTIEECATFQVTQVGAFRDPTEDLRSSVQKKLK